MEEGLALSGRNSTQADMDSNKGPSDGGLPGYQVVAAPSFWVSVPLVVKQGTKWFLDFLLVSRASQEAEHIAKASRVSLRHGGNYMALVLGDMNKCLLFPDKELRRDQSNSNAKVQLGDQ